MNPSAQNSTIVRASVDVRPLDRADAGAVVDVVFAGLSPHSRFMRFHSPVPRLPPLVRAQATRRTGSRKREGTRLDHHHLACPLL